MTAMLYLVTKPTDLKKEILAANLRKFREAAGMSQQDASFAGQFPLDNLRRYEQGTSSPGVFVLEQLAAIYGHDMGDFFNPEPPPAKLRERSPVLLRVVPGMEDDISSDGMERIQATIAKVLRDEKEIRDRKATKKKPPKDD